MSDQKMMTEGQLVRDMEKSYSDLCLSESAEQYGTVTDSSAVAASLPDNCEDRCLSGASSEPAVPPQGGAGGPGSASVMAKMMMMMSSSETLPPESSMSDMMSRMKEGGMPFPNMLHGLPAMMNKEGTEGGPMEIARIFDCIIDMSLAKDDSDESEDEGESASPELPCEYCCRFFSSHMALKTHILVAHDQDDSVLNLTQLTISNEGDKHKSGSPRTRKPSRDTEVFASSVNVKTSKLNSGSDIPTCVELAAAESVNVRGVKRGRIESKDMETVETVGASGVEDHTAEDLEQMPPPSQLESGPLLCVTETSGSSGSTSPELQSECVPMETACQLKPKRSKAKHLVQSSCTSDGGAGNCKDEDSSVVKPYASVSLKDAVKKRLKTEMKNAVTGPKIRSAAKPSVDVVKDTQSPHGAAAAGPSEQAADSPRRSLRSRSLNY